ncbi:sugar phosphate isomerase/epimerase [Nocardioides sp. cx-173]|uniref:sugar phosphate isomerase/epimerase family protein n=1 Tax=Nocardioides sp. cx-173 TaxID=2898796 RepID=UPI001E351768|nr:sugar phosphate isomerase/epimerase [Nocardioides sp. cx-173]MCD4527099.1 sugar phosphate isomerase/epimerase [Nocardioides sp. cx-173]UGB42462.1 sugar phosphate isomerase/epimerase [Nocardioides sp. cx-173]
MAGLGVAAGLGAAPAVAAQGRGHGHGRRRSVPHDKISIQLYTLRAALGGQPGFDVVLQRLAQYGYEKVELAGYYGRTAAQLRDFLQGLGIRATSSHDGISATPAALRTKLENAATLGQRYVVVPYLASASRADWETWADQMNAEARQARRWGLRYGYHNHAHEFTTDLGGGLTPWEVLTERLDPRYVHLEVDLYWVYTGGVNLGVADPDRFTIDVIRRAPQEVRQFHVKDRDAATGDMADLGTGVVDFARIFRTHTVEEYIVENDTPDVTPLTSAAVGHLYLDHLEY